MPRRMQPTYTAAPRHTISVVGDSLTHNITLGVRPDQFWPERVAVALRGDGTPARARNLGRSGNTTTQMLARIATVTAIDIPKLAIIWGGVNDPGNSIVGATTQANIATMGTALLAAGVQYLLVLNTQYLNYSSGGDTVNTPWSTYATLRPFQLAAANALIAAYPGRVAHCDIYAYMRQLIVDGDYTQGDHLWHVADSDQHLNAVGEQIVADAVLATIQAQAGWIAALGGVES